MRANSEIPLSIEKVLAGQYGPLIDVRSEGEFAEATIPGAINVPLFNNVERARVGTLYRQQGPEPARQLGLELVSPKLPDICRRVQAAAGTGPAVLFCWRGGMRSKSVATVLNLMGLETYRLEGGYKSFRRFVNEYFEKMVPSLRLAVLHGNTGVGKTEILTALEQRGIGTVDLESLAENRGSVFGHLGYSSIPSQQTFEGRLVMSLEKHRDKRGIVLEGESRRIGRVVLPQIFYKQMQTGDHIHVYASRSSRVKRLVDIYAKLGQPHELTQALLRLEQRLGKNNVYHLCEAVEQGAYASVAETLLKDYYDPLYGYPNGPSRRYHLSIDSTSVEEAVDLIETYMTARYRV
ncbi:tRNA 2-selenouridine(34) synthase MnmH [Heliobacterium chlorum]|uniref:tRNA 2-selenouridine(34) synthase MnmH n=1 Tax=Heliobacterium chlorum TaxID=2698 RepID=A0ABR7T5F4_HELCL|nr:tRNA 2-selenouridine(34) synthase MnmH [Heliobacterium chlorum]MBC9786017.1 tRNA 2-selenouridine(34) synthase MnmH [Heliobacterium chlorum]